jgi:hypothetical protein
VLFNSFVLRVASISSTALILTSCSLKMADETKNVLVTPILVVGAGPVGMLTALHLGRFGTPCLLAERATETTRWPKMDWTNPRSMELFRMMGYSEEYRNLDGAVGPDHKMDSFFYYSCNPGSEPIASWVRCLNIIRSSVYTLCSACHPSPRRARRLLGQMTALNLRSLVKEPLRLC